jgi:hypothetical protein
MKATAAGVLGAMWIGPGVVEAQRAPEAVVDPQAPPGLKGTPDMRYPLCYQTPVIEGVRVLTNYFAALSRRDAKGMADNMHFPFGTFEGVDAVEVKTPEDLFSHAPASMNLTENPERFTDHDSYLEPGCYDVFDGIEAFNSDPVSVNMALAYNRYGPDGRKLLRCEGVYCATNNDGRWALQLASTIFTPADLIGHVYPDAIMPARRLRIDHNMSFVHRNPSLNDKNGQIGWGANIGAPAAESSRASQTDPNAPARSQTAIRMSLPGGVMALFRVKGIKSRLRMSNTTVEQLNAPSRDVDYVEYRDTFKSLGLGPYGWVFGELPGERIIHHTVDKVHIIAGAGRYTATGKEINTNAQVGIVTYKNKHWGNAGRLAYVMIHDRGNGRP